MNRYGFNSPAASASITATESYVQPWASPIDPFYTPYAQPPPSAPANPLSSIATSIETATPSSTPTDTLYTSSGFAFGSVPAPTSTITSSHVTAADSSFGPATLWAHVSHSVQIAIILFITLAFFAIIIFSFWFCCGGRARWARQGHPLRDRAAGTSGSSEELNPRGEGSGIRGGSGSPNTSMQQISSTSSIAPSQHASTPSSMGRFTELPPPRYEEVVPPQHQHLAGGMSTQRESRDEEEMGVISDGKMPVSEMVFEDVVIERGRGPGSVAAGGMFGMGNRDRVGDTTGHTNT